MATAILHTKIPAGSNFSDAFWDDNYKGVDIIFSRLKKSKETCEEIKKLYESRAHIEQEYGERLLKLSATSKVGEYEEGSFAETLSRIPSTLETTARAHIDLAQQLRDHLEMPLDGFLKEQRDIRKTQYAHIENLKQLKNLHENEVARAREYYSKESTKLISLETHFTVEMEKEIEEQKKLVVVAEQVYKRAIDNLNAVNEQWIYDWRHSADVYQEMELKRITYLRSTLWSFSNMMTSTFNIDEECCDRIRAALEITDVQKDIVDFVYSHGTGSQPPAITPYESFYQPVNRELFSHQNSSESLTRSVTLLANHDEELKSVDIQLQQLEQTPRAEVTQESTLANHGPEPVQSAIEEVEHILNQSGIHDNYIQPTQSVPPVMIDSNRDSSNNAPTENVSVAKEEGAVNKEINNQAVSEEEVIEQHVFHEPKPANNENFKYKPMPNPNFAQLDTEQTKGVHTPPLLQNNKHVEENDDDEEESCENTMPRPPPKDEKWVISSIRRPQQMPIKPTSSPFIQDPLLAPVKSMTGMSIGTPEQSTEEIKTHQAKAHKPVIPLTIDIPNSVNKHPQLAAHKAIEDARRFSQMPPNNVRSQNRVEENGGIRPAPWQGTVHPEDTRNGYVSSHNNHQHGYNRSEQTNLPDSHHQQHGAYTERQPKIKAGTDPAPNKPGKEAKSGGRFSLFFTGGNKKDKKKEKDSYPDLQQHIQQHQQQNQTFQHDQLLNHHAMYQPNTTNDLSMDNEMQFSQLSQAPPLHNTANRFVCYVKAQWSFEATIDAEMTFNQDEVLGIIHKQSDGWWQAERLISEAAGQRGLVPGNYMIDTSM